MRLFSFIPTLAVLVTAVMGAALPRDVETDDCGAEAGCKYAGLSLKRDVFEHPSRTVNEMTNAELLRRGLPLNNPVVRRGAYTLVCAASFNLINVPLSGTPVRRHGPSAAPDHGKKNHRGYIAIRSQSDHSILGYISRDATDLAQYRVDSNRDNALVVKFKTDSSGSGTQLNITPEVGPDSLLCRAPVSQFFPPELGYHILRPPWCYPGSRRCELYLVLRILQVGHQTRLPPILGLIMRLIVTCTSGTPTRVCSRF